jgi:hypothetical protein
MSHQNYHRAKRKYEEANGDDINARMLLLDDPLTPDSAASNAKRKRAVEWIRTNFAGRIGK